MSSNPLPRLESVNTATLLRGLSLGGSLLSIGLSLARVVPAESPAWLAIAVAIVLLTVNQLADWLCRAQLADAPANGTPGSLWISLAVPLLAGFAWSPAGSVATCVTLILVGLLALTANLCAAPARERIATYFQGARRAASPATDPPCRAVEVEPNPAPASVTALSPHVSETVSEDHPESTANSELLQQLLRRASPEREWMEVQLRAAFAAGERQISLHLPIAPPFPVSPEVDCEPLDEFPLEITVGACHPYGIRIDVARSGDFATPLVTTIGVHLVHARFGRSAA
jgi:hypothetical protein